MLGWLRLFKHKVLDVIIMVKAIIKRNTLVLICRSSILAVDHFSEQDIHYVPSESSVCITLTCMILYLISTWFLLFQIFGHKISSHLLVNCHWHVSSYFHAGILTQGGRAESELALNLYLILIGDGLTESGWYRLFLAICCCTGYLLHRNKEAPFYIFGGSLLDWTATVRVLKYIMLTENQQWRVNDYLIMVNG